MKASRAIAATFLLCALPVAAQAQDSDIESRALDLNLAPAAEIADTPIIGLSPTLSGALADLAPLQSDAAPVLGLSADCATGRAGCVGRVGTPERLDFGYSKPLNAGSVAGIDLELEPRGAIRFGDTSDSALVGAVVRIGDDLRENGQRKNNTWYLFAGADAEAMTYDPSTARGLGSGQFGLQDRVIVGDAQAGIGYRLGNRTDVSVGYFRREVQSLEDNDPTNDFSITEDAAAVSFTWRR